MTRPRPLVPRGDPADSVRVVGEFGVIARVLAQAGSARAARGRSRRRRRRAADPRRAGRGDAPTSSSRAGTSGATGPRPRTSATRRPRPTWPTSPRWAGRPTALLVGLACPADTPTTWLEGVAAGLAAECAPLGAAVVGRRHGGVGAGQRRRRPLGDGAGRPGRPGAGAAVGRAARGRGGAGRPAGLVGVRARRAAAGLHQPDRGRGRAPAARSAVRGRPGRRRCRSARRCATSATGCWPTPGTSPPTAGSSWTWTVPRWSGRAWSRRAPLQQVGSALGVDPMAWVLTGGEDHALVATFPAARGPAGGLDRDRRGAHRPRAGRPGERLAAADVGARGRGGGSRACPLRLSGCCATGRVALRPLPYDDPVAHVPGRAGAGGVRRSATAGATPPSWSPPSSCRRAGSFLVAEVDGVPAGCGAWRVHVAGVVEIKRVYVEPAFRRRGLAQVIVEALEDGCGPGGSPLGGAEHRAASSRRRWRCTPGSATARAGVRRSTRRHPMRGFSARILSTAMPAEMIFCGPHRATRRCGRGRS